MPSLNYSIEDVHKFLGILTWKKIIQLIVFLFVMGLTWATYENKAAIYGFASQKRLESSAPIVHSLSKKTTDEIDTIVKKSEIIVGMNITLADFQRNQRVTVYRGTETTELTEIFDIYAKTSIGNVPLFNNDVENNEIMVNLINGEFVCKPLLSTMTGKLIPDSKKYIHTICMNGIPASFGKFTGIISVQLKKQPTPSEIDQLRAITRQMATTVFERDLSKY